MARINFKIDLVSAVKRQLGWDNDRKNREAAKSRADPIVAHRISEYHTRYPHLTPGVTLSAAKMGYDPDGPEIAKLAELAYRRRLTKGQGDYSIGDDPSLKDNPRRWFEEQAQLALDSGSGKNVKAPLGQGGVLDVFKPAARSVAVFGESIKEVVAASARGTVQAIEDRDLNMLLNPLAAGQKIVSSGEITGIEAVKSLAAGKGSGLGHGYIPHGVTTERQAEAARESYSLEYSDNSLFGGEKQPVERHAGTLGRIIFKDVFEPGSFWFQLASGAVDFTAAFATDPAAKLSKAFAGKTAAKAAFTAEEAGRTITPAGKVIPAVSREAGDIAEEASTLPVPFSAANEDAELVGKTRSQINEILTNRRKAQIANDIGLVQGRRSTVHGPTMTNWLTTHKDGQAFIKAVTAESDAYTIWKKMSGEGSQLSPLLARKMADITDETEMVAALSPDLGVGFKLKPEVGHLNHVGGAFEGVGIKDNLRSVRMLNTMPRGTIDVDDLPNAATQITRYLRNAKVPEEAISPHFDALTRALTTEDRVDVMRNVVWTGARHIAENELTTLGHKPSIDALNRNFNTLRSIHARDMEIVDRLNKMHAAQGTGVDRIVINGELSAPLRSHWEDIEASRLFYFPNPREIKKITSTYGRLISNDRIEMVPIALDAINSFMKGVSILRPALTVRVIGDQLARMTVEGYDTIFNNPRSAIAWMTGSKGGIDIFGENFDSLDEFSKFKKELVHHGDLHSKISMEAREVVPFTDKRFLSGWADDIQYLTEHPVAARLAGRWEEGQLTGNFLEDTKKWLASADPEAVAYRAETPELNADNLSSFVDQINSTLTAKTYNNPTLVDAVRTGIHNGEPIITTTPGGKPKFSRAFKAHLKTLVDTDKSPELTIGDFRQIKNRDDLNLTRRVSDKLFSYLLTRPANYMNNSPTFRQAYWKSATDELIIHASPEAQSELIRGAQDANLGKSVIDAMKKKAASVSGDLTLKEVDFHANARAAEAVSDLFYNLQDRGQFMDSMRLIWPFGEAWKEALDVWSKLMLKHPQIIPRALMAANGARESGFIYTDPATGQEMFAYPGGQFINKSLFGIPAPLQAPIGSLNMVTGGKNPYMPGFGILVQTPVAAFLPDVPKYDFIRDLITPYEPKDLSNPWNLLPSWAQPIRDVIGSPAHEVQYMNNFKDVMAYLKSSGQYSLESQADMAKLEERATQIARNMTVFTALAKSTLPATPSFRDVAEDKEGHTTFAFALTDRYRQLLEKDREEGTNRAVIDFLDEFGEKNLLYMQSASKGGDVFTKSGYDWVRDNQAIAKTYPEIYGLLAPQDGGFDIKAYHAMFENGTRKPLTPREMLNAAQNRVAKAMYRNAQDKLPPTNHRTPAQKEWLANIKADLLDRYPSFVPEFQGNDIPVTIRRLSEAVTDKRVSKLPVAKAISEYLTYRQKVADLAAQHGITGWQTAKSAKPQRDWLRTKAAEITSKYPSFKEVNRELFDQELGED